MRIFADRQTIKQILIQKLRPPFIHCGLWIVGERANMTNISIITYIIRNLCPGNILNLVLVSDVIFIFDVFKKIYMSIEI